MCCLILILNMARTTTTCDSKLIRYGNWNLRGKRDVQLIKIPQTSNRNVTVIILLQLGPGREWASISPVWIIYTSVHHKTAKVVGNSWHGWSASWLNSHFLHIVLNKYHTQWKVAGKLLFSPYDIRPVDTGEKKIVPANAINDQCKGTSEDSCEKARRYSLLSQKNEIPKTCKPVPNYVVFAVLFTVKQTVQVWISVHLCWSI